MKKQVVLIGWPIAHSLSPSMHNAAFAQAGLDWTYNLFPTKPSDLEATLRTFDEQNVVGGNVTMPHKQTIIPYLSDISEDARFMGAVNAFRIQDGKLFGYNTDARGFVNALISAGHSPAGMQVVILGAGGAAGAAAFSLAQAGTRQITIVNRTPERGSRLANTMSEAFPACEISFQPLSPETLTIVSESTTDLLVNATPVGMEPDENSSPWPADLPLPANSICYDVIYKPIKTQFIKQAEAAGHKTLNGLGMLIHQGVAAFEIWTGRKASIDTLTEACTKALAANKP